MISWKITKQDSTTIEAIVERVEKLCKKYGAGFDPLQVNMDLTATHANGCRLRLKDLLNAPDFDFSHDVFGIARHLDRETGTLKECFLPRYAEREGRETT